MKFLHEWDGSFLDFTDDVEKESVAETIAVSKQIWDIMIDLSPVDTGSFRNSWNATVGTPVEIFNLNKDWKNPLPAAVWPNPKPKFGESIHMTNGAPYAQRLEDGWSGQAPYGMVAVALEAVGD